MKHVVLAAFLLAGACGEESSPRSSGSQAEVMLGGRPLSEFFIEHDRFVSVTDPSTVSRAQARFLLPDDEVFGVFEGGKARAYPITMLSYYHVVNDVLGGVPVAVTY